MSFRTKAAIGAELLVIASNMRDADTTLQDARGMSRQIEKLATELLVHATSSDAFKAALPGAAAVTAIDRDAARAFCEHNLPDPGSDLQIDALARAFAVHRGRAEQGDQGATGAQGS